MKRAFKKCGGYFLLGGFILLPSLFLNAQVARHFVNFSFEEPDITLAPYSSTTYIQTNENNVPGWGTSATDNLIELWRSGFLGVPSHSGSQFAELNATQPSKLSQTVCMIAGESFTWSFWHRGRSGIDTCRVLLGGVEQARMGTGTSAWAYYSGTYVVPSNGPYAFEFEAVYASGGLSVGNFLDDIKVIPALKAFVEFKDTFYQDFEAAGGNIPKVRVVEDVQTAQTVDVSVTGGSASGGGVDYSYTSTVTIPIGYYDGGAGSLFPITLSIADDGVLESDEYIYMSLINPSASLLIESIDSCGGDEHSYSTYKIMDDEPMAIGDLDLLAAFGNEPGQVNLELHSQYPEAAQLIEIQDGNETGEFMSLVSFQPIPDEAVYHCQENHLVGTHFFRAHAIDNNGQEFYSNIEQLNFLETSISNILYPNPAHDFFMIRTNSSEGPNPLIEIIDCQGKWMASPISEKIRDNEYKISLGDGLSSGYYIVKVTQGIDPPVFSGLFLR